MALIESSKVALIKMFAISITSAKLATTGFLINNLFWNKSYDVIISVHELINKISSRDSNDIVDVVMWPKFGNSSISMKEVILT